MPLRLSVLTARLRDTEAAIQTSPIRVGDDELVVRWTPLLLTPALESRIREATPEQEDALIVEVLSTLVVSWDLLDDDDVPWPTNVESIGLLPTPFLRQVYLELGSEARPNPPSAPSSRASSRRAGSSARRRSGTGTSKRRVISA